MAEFPELGKNCSLDACNRLDYTPFLCQSCKRYYCSQHRLSHGCGLGAQATTSNDIGQKCRPSTATPLRPYLCAMDGCHSRESVRIECPTCKRIFCLRHRHVDDHSCEYLQQQQQENGAKQKREREAIRAEIQKKIESSLSHSNASRPATSTSEVKPKKVLNEVEQKRADRIAIMRLKSKAKTCDIPNAEQMFLVVLSSDDGDDRIPIMISKRWTIGKCVDRIANELKIQNKNSDFEAKMLRLYLNDDDHHLSALPMGDNVAKYLKDMDVVLVKRDQ